MPLALLQRDIAQLKIARRDPDHVAHFRAAAHRVTLDDHPSPVARLADDGHVRRVDVPVSYTHLQTGLPGTPWFRIVDRYRSRESWNQLRCV